MKTKSILKAESILLIAATCLLLASCTKEVPSSMIEADTYMRVYPFEGDQSIRQIKPTSDGGYLLIGNGAFAGASDGYKVCLLKINERGDLLWNRVVADSTGGPLITEMKDGSLLMCGSGGPGYLTKLDKDGNLIFSTEYRSTHSSGYLSYPVQTTDGNYYLTAYTDGASSGAPSKNRLVAFNPDGTLVGYKAIDDTCFGKGLKILYLSLHKSEKTGSYLFNGWCFKNWNLDWATNFKIFVAKQQWSDNGDTLLYSKTVLIDSLNIYNKNRDIYQFYTKDNKLILLGSQVDYNSISKGRIMKIDDDLNILWEKDLIVSPYGTYFSNMSQSPDGSFLIAGTCKVATKISDQPFVCKVDQNGNIIWSKIYSTTLGGALTYVLQTPNNGYIMAGQTNGFGKGASVSDVFVMKTDAQGNFE